MAGAMYIANDYLHTVDVRLVLLASCLTTAPFWAIWTSQRACAGGAASCSRHRAVVCSLLLVPRVCAIGWGPASARIARKDAPL